MGDALQDLGPEWFHTTPEHSTVASDTGRREIENFDPGLEAGVDLSTDEVLPEWLDEPSSDPGPISPAAPAAYHPATQFPTQRRVRRQLPDAGPEGSADRVQSILREVLASLHGQPAEVVSATVARIRREKSVCERVPDEWRSVLDGALEVLNFECTALAGVGVIDFEFLPAAANHSVSVASEFTFLLTIEMTPNPMSVFESLVEAVQAGVARQAALRLVRVIDEKSTAARKMEVFRSIPAPTRQREVQNNTWAKNAAEWMDEHRASEGAATELILSSGYPSLDSAASGAGDLSGLIKPGEFWVGGAGTGHGKSAFTRRVFTSMLLDLTQGWGLKHAQGILGFTEEEAWDVAKAAMLDKGQPYHHVAQNAVLAKLGESRKRVVTVVYDSVVAAVKKSEATGAPITEFLPYIYFLDYIQAIKEPGENADTEGVARTADLMMRGIAAWDPEMMGAISGLDFQEYAGMRWPDGMDHHRVAVFCLSQLRKEGTDHTVFYRKGKSQVTDFTVVDANGMPMWEPLEDDYAVPNRSDLRGSGVLLNHATGLIFFHRSRPTASVRKDTDGKVLGLTDTRARFIVPKARKSVSMPFVPMRFDSNPEGFRGQFYDDLAWQHCVVEGRMEVSEVTQTEGDPILPKRPARSPWTVSY